MSAITIDAKKEFINWFLKNNQLKSREAVWILNYLFSHERALKKLHFVDNARDIEEEHLGLVISARGKETAAFKCVYQGEKHNSGEKAFHLLRTLENVEIYVELHFAATTPDIYFQVLEDVPGQQVMLVGSEQVMIEKMIKQSQVKTILNKIDKALDQGDEKSFMELFNIYKNL